MNLLTLILSALAIMGSPGPSTMSATAVAAAYGLRRSLPYAAGLIVGTCVVLLTVAVGIVALVLSVPHAGPLLVAMSSLYILYLAWQIATAPPLAARGDGPAEAPGWIGGFLLAVANPKAFVAIAAVFAGTTVLPDDPGLDAIMKTSVLCGMIVAIHLGWLMVGAALSRVLQRPAWSRVINVTLAAVLVATTALTVLG